MITDEQVTAALVGVGYTFDEVLHEPNRVLMRRALEAYEAAAWSKDITKADKSRKIFAKIGADRIVIAYYTDQHYVLNKGWQTNEMGYVADDTILSWRYLPEPPK